jgi:hypothetical protein
MGRDVVAGLEVDRVDRGEVDELLTSIVLVAGGTNGANSSWSTIT